MTPSSLLLCALAMLIAVCHGKNLYPRCGGAERKTTSLWDAAQAHEVMHLGYGQKLMLDCVAFHVSLLTTTPECAAVDPFPYRFYVRATNVDHIPRDEQTGTVMNYVEKFDLSEVAGGSVERLTYTMRANTSWSLQFHNQHPRKCDAQLHSVVQHHIEETAALDTATVGYPALVAVSPLTFFLPDTVTLRFHALPRTFGSDNMRVVMRGRPCSDSAGVDPIPNALGGNNSMVDPDDAFDDGAAAPIHYDPATVSEWFIKFQSTGTFDVCYKHHHAELQKVAQLTVFGSNPAYFVVVNGGDAEGRIFIGVPLELEFRGNDLDTRPGKDMAKIVSSKFNCIDGAPDGGVPLIDDLDPDCHGPTCTFARWKLMFTLLGSYRICYKRANGEWVEVVNQNELPADQDASPQVPPPPVNETRYNGKTCAPAPPRANPPQHRTLLELTLARTNLPSNFSNEISQALCVPPQYIFVHEVRRHEFIDRLAHVERVWSRVVMDIACPDLTVCNSRDRMNEMIRIGIEEPDLLKGIGLRSVAEIPEGNGLLIRDPDHPITHHEGGPSSKSMVFIIVGCLIAVVGVSVGVGAVWYAKRGYPMPFAKMPPVTFGSTQEDAAEMA